MFDIEKYLKAGIDRCLIKPVKLAELGQVCRQLLDGTFSGGTFAADGCTGSLYSLALAPGNSVSFAITTTSLSVWDHITLLNGATFGTIGQTFQQAATPEPLSSALTASALAFLLLGRSWLLRRQPGGFSSGVAYCRSTSHSDWPGSTHRKPCGIPHNANH